MNRKAAEFWWNLPIKGIERKKFVPPPEVAFYAKNDFSNKWEVTTWKDIFVKRKIKQDLSIANKCRHEKIKPAFIWVFFNNSWIMGGWYIYIKTLHKDYALNFKTNWKNEGKYKSIIDKIMQAYPSGILAFDFYQWAPHFAKQYHHTGFNRTKQGLVKCLCKVNKYGELEDVFPIGLKNELNKKKKQN
jgi:hypothetical protein